MPLRQALFASAALTLVAGAAQAFTLHVAHFNDFHSRVELINAFEFDLLRRGRDRGRMLRRRRPPRDRGEGAARRDGRQGRARHRARGRRRLPGLALLHRLFRPGRGRDAEPHRPRRHGLRQPRVRPRPRAAGQVHRDRRLPGHLRQRRRLRRQPARPPRPRPSRARGRRREGGDPRRHHARTPPRSRPPARPSASAPRSTTCAAWWPRSRPRAWTRSSSSATSAPSATRRWRRRCPASTSSSAATATRSTPTPPRTRRSSIRSWSTAPTATPSPSSRPAPTPSTSATSPSPSTTQGVVTEAVGDTKPPRRQRHPRPRHARPHRGARRPDRGAQGPRRHRDPRRHRRQPRDLPRAGMRRWATSSPTPWSTGSRTRASPSALTNGGGLRASIGAGTVTMGDVLAVLPFQNTLSTFNIPGSGIVAALENGVSQVEEGAGRFPQVSGLRFSWDPKAPAMSRIKSVEVREGDAWVPLDPAKVYAVASNNFMRAGGDGYVSLARRGDQRLRLRPRPRGRARRLHGRAPGLRPRPRAADHRRWSEAAPQRQCRLPSVSARQVPADAPPSRMTVPPSLLVRRAGTNSSPSGCFVRCRTRSSACVGAGTSTAPAAAPSDAAGPRDSSPSRACWGGRPRRPPAGAPAASIAAEHAAATVQRTAVLLQGPARVTPCGAKRPCD